jgi:tRNA threonylcarbamoyl adenosine modification protein YeaZ
VVTSAVYPTVARRTTINLGVVLVLTLDTSTPAVTAAVSRVGSREMVTTLAAGTEVANNRHGELLAPMIEAVLVEAEAEPGDLAAIGVGLGPGPFTGLRVGIMTAAAMGDALGIPVYGECSLDVISSSLPRGANPFAVLTDARRKQVYWASYDHTGARVEGPDIATPADLAAHLTGRVTQVIGAGALAYREHFDDFTIVEEPAYPDAAALGRLIAPKVAIAAPADDLTPLYLRRPDATPPGRPKQVTPV